MEVRGPLDDDALGLEAGPRGRHLAGVAREPLHVDRERRLGDVAAGEEDAHTVVALLLGKVVSRVGLLVVLVVGHLAGKPVPAGPHDLGLDVGIAGAKGLDDKLGGRVGDQAVQLDARPAGAHLG